jgi:hypothetical protein
MSPHQVPDYWLNSNKGTKSDMSAWPIPSALACYACVVPPQLPARSKPLILGASFPVVHRGSSCKAVFKLDRWRPVFVVKSTPAGQWLPESSSLLAQKTRTEQLAFPEIKNKACASFKLHPNRERTFNDEK